MLAIKLKKGDSFTIGENILVTVVSCGPSAVRVAIKAPEHLRILRHHGSDDLTKAGEVSSGNLLCK
jgi:carbon storage regulator CsrA